MKKYAFLFFVLCSFSCRNNCAQIQRKDVIMGQYLRVKDSLPGELPEYKTFSILKAYHDNDTNYLNGAVHEIEDLRKRILQMSALICVDPTPLDNANFEEAYNFQFSQAFCRKHLSMTIGKRNDSIIFDIALYLRKDIDGNGACELISHYTEKLTASAWNEIKESLYRADFWGLENYNDEQGFDGSSLIINGHRNRINIPEGENHFIYRWAAEDTAIGEALKKCFKLSGLSVDCPHYMEE